jgi:3-methyladenine DNA glycosylase AlkD
LPANDEVRTTAIAAIDTDLVAFKDASAALTAARTEEAMAKTRLDAAEEAWERLMNKVYGILFSELGRKRAEQFFPKVRSGAKKDDDDTD